MRVDDRLLMIRPIKVDIPKPGHELTWRDYLKLLDSIFKFRAKLNSGLNVASTTGAALSNGYSTWLWRYWRAVKITDNRSLQIDKNWHTERGKMMQETPDEATAKKLIKDQMEVLKKVTGKAGPVGEIFEEFMNESLQDDPFGNWDRIKKRGEEKLKEKLNLDKMEKLNPG